MGKMEAGEAGDTDFKSEAQVWLSGESLPLERKKEYEMKGHMGSFHVMLRPKANTI